MDSCIKILYNCVNMANTYDELEVFGAPSRY